MTDLDRVIARLKREANKALLVNLHRNTLLAIIREIERLRDKYEPPVDYRKTGK